MAIRDIFKGSELRKRITELEQQTNALYQDNIRLHAQLSPEQKQALSLENRIHQLQVAIEQGNVELERISNQQNAAIAQAEVKLIEITNKKTQVEVEIKAKKSQLVTFDDEILVQEFGLYKPRYSFASSSHFKDELDKIRERQKHRIKTLDSETSNAAWTVNGSRAQGKKMVKDMQRLLLRAYNSECDDVISKVKFSNIERSVEKIKKSAEIITKLGTVTHVSIPYDYVKMKTDEAYLAFEYVKIKEQEKEALREAREQEREELRVQKEIEAKRKDLQKEQLKYSNTITDLQNRLANDPDNAAMIEKIKDLTNSYEEVKRAIESVDYREANKRAGYVYIISNIGSFGENIFKIGMTRRLNPLERVSELSDASVPFNFDVHALIFSDDAPSLEAALHREFESKRLNLVNLRREFFTTTIQEIEEVVKRNYDKTVDFSETPDAEQYRVSSKMRVTMRGNTEL